MNFKLKGNESFNIREGWLAKGIAAIQEDPSVFSQPTAMDTLGVGSKMVKSIRFWLQATGLTVENHGPGKRQQLLTPGFGEIIVQHDQYFEDIATLWFLHSKIVSNDSLCTAWYIFFNLLKMSSFSREDLHTQVTHMLDKSYGENTYSRSSAKDDCNYIINMYFQGNTSQKDPEENTDSPFSELGLIQSGDNSRNEFKKTQPMPDKLDKLVVLYLLLGMVDPKRNSVSVDDLLTKPRSIGCILNLSRSTLYDYLDALHNSNYIEINRTAGLDMVYLKESMLQEEILQEYYR